MAKPSAPSVGTRAIYYPAPTELSGGCAPLPAIVISPAGMAPDYLGTTYGILSTPQHKFEAAMAIVRNIQFRPQSRGTDKAPIPGTCGRPAERECGMKNPLECSTHAPLQPNPEADKARSRARAIRATISAGFGCAPTQ